MDMQDSMSRYIHGDSAAAVVQVRLARSPDSPAGVFSAKIVSTGRTRVQLAASLVPPVLLTPSARLNGLRTC